MEPLEFVCQPQHRAGAMQVTLAKARQVFSVSRIEFPHVFWASNYDMHSNKKPHQICLYFSSLTVSLQINSGRYSKRLSFTYWFQLEIIFVGNENHLNRWDRFRWGGAGLFRYLGLWVMKKNVIVNEFAGDRCINCAQQACCQKSIDSFEFMHFLHANLPKMQFQTQSMGAAMQLSEGAASEAAETEALGLTAHLHSSEYWNCPNHHHLFWDFSQPKLSWNGFVSCSETRTQIFHNMCI